MAKILHADPVSIADAGVAAPPELARIVKKCLAKGRDRRYQGAEDLRVDLRNLSAELEAGVAAAPYASGDASSSAPANDRAATPVFTGPRFIVAGLVGVGLVALGFILGRQTSAGSDTGPERPGLQAELLVTPEETMERSVLRALTFSPEGDEIIFAATDEGGRRRLYRRRLDASLATPIAGTEGGAGPLVSPNGEWILFWAAGALAKVPRGGGAAEVLHRLTADTPDRSAAGWGTDLGPSSDVPYGMTWEGDDAVVSGRRTVPR